MTRLKIWLTFIAAAMLIWADRSCSVQYNTLTVDPPDEVLVLDPGHLGLLEVHWTPPASLLQLTECHKRYQLEHFNPYRNRWTVIRTRSSNYSIQADLNREVKVRVYTLLKGPCTNGSEVKSSRFTEKVLEPQGTGATESMLQGFVCVFHKMEYTECTWNTSPLLPNTSVRRLIMWYEGLEQTMECPEYIIADGVRQGCNFSKSPLPTFTDINLCLNGSAPNGLLRTSFYYMQIQNHVKPAATEKIHVQAGTKNLHLNWEPPSGKVHGVCLEWEVEHQQDGKTFLPKTTTMMMEMTLPFPTMSSTERNCFRVRSKMHKYCANAGFWSDWSRWTCHPGGGPCKKRLNSVEPLEEVWSQCPHNIG